MRYLGLDLGSKTLGVSTSDSTKTISSTLKTIYFKEDDYQSLIEPLKKIIYDYEIEKIILGFPKNMDNSIGTRASITLEFKKYLEKELNIEVILQDERLTSVISNQVLIEADISRKKRKKKVDSIAAQIILQSYLDSMERKDTNGKKRVN
jgi:putative Holliday junction resolvase